MQLAVAVFFGLLATMLAVLAIMTQAPPEVAISNLAKWYGRYGPGESLPAWLTRPGADDWAFWILLTLAAILFVGGAWFFKKSHAATTCQAGLLPVDDHVPLNEAARVAYEQVERQLLGRLARGSRRGPLAFMAEKVFYEVPVVLGKQPPSTRLLPIKQVAGQAFRFSEDGGSLLEGQTPVVTDLCVKRADFDAALQSLKQSADGESRGSWDADEMVPLRDAVGIAMGATRGSSLAAFNANRGEDGTVFGYFSAMLDHKTPIYGRTTPANDWVLLGRVDLSKETLWEMKSIKPHHKPVRITDLSIKRGDLTTFCEAVSAAG